MTNEIEKPKTEEEKTAEKIEAYRQAFFTLCNKPNTFDEGWNERFKKLAETLGLALDPTGKVTGPNYPQTKPFWAPQPYLGEGSTAELEWPYGTVVIWIEDKPK